VSDNPHAFPNDGRGSSEFAGMTLRDYFAAKAMQAMVTSYRLPQLRTNSDRVPLHNVGSSRPDTGDIHQYRKSLAALAYAIADAMLEARKPE
jgi:hypothetical protein